MINLASRHKIITILILLFIVLAIFMLSYYKLPTIWLQRLSPSTEVPKSRLLVVSRGENYSQSLNLIELDNGGKESKLVRSIKSISRVGGYDIEKFWDGLMIKDNVFYLLENKKKETLELIFYNLKTDTEKVLGKYYKVWPGNFFDDNISENSARLFKINDDEVALFLAYKFSLDKGSKEVPGKLFFYNQEGLIKETILWEKQGKNINFGSQQLTANWAGEDLGLSLVQDSSLFYENHKLVMFLSDGTYIGERLSGEDKSAIKLRCQHQSVDFSVVKISCDINKPFSCDFRCSEDFLLYPHDIVSVSDNNFIGVDVYSKCLVGGGFLNSCLWGEANYRSIVSAENKKKEKLYTWFSFDGFDRPLYPFRLTLSTNKKYIAFGSEDQKTLKLGILDISKKSRPVFIDEKMYPLYFETLKN